MTDIENELTKLTAERHLRSLEAYDTLSRDQVIAQSKWLNASLLAVNSGGLIAAMQSTEQARDSLALACFIIGVGAALFSAVVIQDVYAKLNPSIIKASEPYWREVALTGKRDSEKEENLRAISEKANWRTYAAPALGYLSGLAWLAGALALAL